MLGNWRFAVLYTRPECAPPAGPAGDRPKASEPTRVTSGRSRKPGRRTWGRGIGTATMGAERPGVETARPSIVNDGVLVRAGGRRPARATGGPGGWPLPSQDHSRHQGSPGGPGVSTPLVVARYGRLAGDLRRVCFGRFLLPCYHRKAGDGIPLALFRQVGGTRGALDRQRVLDRRGGTWARCGTRALDVGVALSEKTSPAGVGTSTKNGRVLGLPSGTGAEPGRRRQHTDGDFVARPGSASSAPAANCDRRLESLGVRCGRGAPR